MAGRRVRSGGAYHHGDLRAAVIAAGLKRLAKRNGVTIGLRALSRDVGVSATALYRYFPDKEALFDALADEGLRRLGAQQAQAWVKAGGGRASFLRSEEHTSELQSLMRISYAVFCLQKKTHNTIYVLTSQT